ncbi:MAG: hypothetical protein WC130_11650 [Kiritimatiellia bacterium]
MMIKIDAEAFTTANVGFLRNGGVAMITVPGRDGFVRARIVGDEIEVIPERSSDHKALCAALGQ